MADLVDSYSEANQDGYWSLQDLHPSDEALTSSGGQSFTMLGSNYKITSAVFYLRRSSLSPTGNGHAVLYAHTGTYGTSSVPTGAALATSDDFDVSTLTTSYQLITFTFTGAEQYEMVANTKYCIAFENPVAGTVDATHWILQGRDGSSPTHDGNSFKYENGAYSAFSAIDTCFYVYGDALGVSIPVAMHHYSHHISKIIRG